LAWLVLALSLSFIPSFSLDWTTLLIIHCCLLLDEHTIYFRRLSNCISHPLPRSILPVCCSILPCPALPCSALPYPALPCSILPYPTLPYPTLPSSSTICSVLSIATLSPVRVSVSTQPPRYRHTAHHQSSTQHSTSTSASTHISDPRILLAHH
jgi:hypothetical protein